ncbi:hypothetical protein BV581_20185 [Stutzerimonas stutzeri]|nr:hypothetical protein BV581_20185 [Stutzerimonas stutzeri]
MSNQLIKGLELIQQPITDAEEYLPVLPCERHTQPKPEGRLDTLKQLRVANRPSEGFRVMTGKVQQQLDADCIIEMQRPAECQAREFGLSNRIRIKPERCRRQALRTLKC